MLVVFVVLVVRFSFGFNLLNAELNPSCKSQLAEFF